MSITVYVIMGNDYPHSVFADEEDAERFVKAKSAEDKREFPQRRIFWRSYAFEVIEHAPAK